MAKEDRALRSGERIAGTNYVVIQYESGGGHGALYRVRHYELTKRIFALKLLHADLRSNTDLAVRMKREGRILAAMNHPNIVPVYDAGTTQEVDPDTHQSLARPFLAMEWLKGRSLATILAGVHGIGIGLHDALEISIEVGDALDYAHTKHGVIHRDIKPDNVFLQAAASADGKTITRLLDFGVAAVLGAEKITQRPTILGTPRYASPEQLRGEPPTPQTDLYGFGLLLYEMLVGYGPFDDHHGLAAMMRAHLKLPAAPLPSRDFPDAIVQLVAACLEKRPESRPRSGNEVVGRLREIKEKAKERRAQNLAALSKTDPMAVASAIIPASLEATDPGAPTGVDNSLPPDNTSPGIPLALQADELPKTVSRHLGVVDTQVEAVPFGAQAQASIAHRNPQLLIKTSTPSVASLIDRLAITQTSPPMPARVRNGGSTEALPLPAPPPFIDGARVYAMGDRYVLDPDSITPSPSGPVPTPPRPVADPLRITPPQHMTPAPSRITPVGKVPILPPRLGAASVLTTTNGAAMSVTSSGLPRAPSRSLLSLMRLRVPVRYAGIVGGAGAFGLLVIVLIGALRIRSAHQPPRASASTGAATTTALPTPSVPVAMPSVQPAPPPAPQASVAAPASAAPPSPSATSFVDAPAASTATAAAPPDAGTARATPTRQPTAPPHRAAPKPSATDDMSEFITKFR
jgi:serine/threonine protein kinase